MPSISASGAYLKLSRFYIEDGETHEVVGGILTLDLLPYEAVVLYRKDEPAAPLQGG